MQPVEAFKPLGLITIAITWLALGLLVYKSQGDKRMSFSRHAAANKTAFTTLAIIEPFILSGFFLFIYKWFVPTFRLPALFTVLVGLSSLGLLIAAWIPDVAGWKHKVHEWTAYPAVILFIPISLIMCFVSGLPAFVRGAWIIALVYNTACVTFFLFSKKAKEYHLYLQAPYFVLTHLAILLTAYIR